MTDTRSTPADIAAPGSQAPDFNLKDQQGRAHKLANYKGQWVVLYFYPKDDTPGCTKEACQFRDQHADFGKINAVVLGVSPDDEASHAKFAKKFSLPFPLLADTDKTLCQAYGVWKEKNMYGIKRMGVVRTTILIDPQGKIAHRWNNVKVDGHDQAILTRIAELSA